MRKWRIVAHPRDFERFRRDEAFAELLTLGRIANLLRSATALGIDHGAGEGGASERARMSSALLLSGLIAEALPVLERSGKHFRHLQAFREGVLPILKAPESAELKEKWLSPLRNQAVFHNDATVSQSGFAELRPLEAQDLAKGDSEFFMDLYYPLADAVAVAYVLNEGGARHLPELPLGRYLSGTVQLATRICFAVDTLIGQALAERGFAAERSPDTSG